MSLGAFFGTSQDSATVSTNVSLYPTPKLTGSGSGFRIYDLGDFGFRLCRAWRGEGLGVKVYGSWATTNGGMYALGMHALGA